MREGVSGMQDTNQDKNRRAIEIFWTGGFDSSFRVCQLSKLPIVIKPFYLCDNRKSEGREIKAITQIITALKDKDDTRCVFTNLEIIGKEERPHHPVIEAAYQRLRLQFPKLGSQYEWLACFANKHPGIEMSLEKRNDVPGIVTIIADSLGASRTIHDPDIGEYEVIDARRSNPDVVTVFGNVNLPLMYRYTKLDMLEEYIRLGCRDIVDLTWFCFRPVDGLPCGECNPCTCAINEGFEWRFTRESLARYRAKRDRQADRGVSACAPDDMINGTISHDHAGIVDVVIE
jgi:7-cyano-7-deazaguanine synthase